jgi:hypothetical protein
MIFDSTVWIDYSRGVINTQTNLLDGFLAQGEPVDICPTILQEVLQGIKKESEYEQLREVLFEMNFLMLDPYFVAEEAAKLYRQLRRKGTTINKPNDCVIAFYAIHFDHVLVHNDKDFDKISKHSKLKVYRTK